MRSRLWRADVAITLVFLVIAATALLQAARWPLRAALFPIGTAAVLLLVVLLKLALDLARPPAPAKPVPHHTAMSEEDATEPELEDVFATATRAEWTSALGWMGLFFLLLWVLGALVAVPLFAVIYLLLVSRESPVVTGAYAFACWLFTYGLFHRLLHVPLPAGVLTASVGW
jgi:hypothetical protein